MHIWTTGWIKPKATLRLTGAGRLWLSCGTDRHIASVISATGCSWLHMCGNHVADEQLLRVSKWGTLCWVGDRVKFKCWIGQNKIVVQLKCLDEWQAGGLVTRCRPLMYSLIRFMCFHISGVWRRSAVTMITQLLVIGGNGRGGGPTRTRRAGEFRARLRLICLSCPMSRRLGWATCVCVLEI